MSGTVGGGIGVYVVGSDELALRKSSGLWLFRDKRNINTGDVFTCS